MWSATRWQTYNIMSAFANLKEIGVYRPTDLIKFPWEKEDTAAPSDDGMEELSQMLLEEQEHIKAEKEQSR